jgi:transcription antitermination factor NusA-like protein
MKPKICQICLKADVLCTACQSHLDSGEITEDEIRILRTIFSLSKEHPSLKGVEVLGVKSVGNTIFIITKPQDVGKLVGRGGKIVSLLSQKLDKPVKIIETTQNISHFVQSVLKPAKVVGVNQVFKTDGKTYYKIRIKEHFKLPLEKEACEGLLNDLLDIPAKIITE